jgi:hypothetical protein
MMEGLTGPQESTRILRPLQRAADSRDVLASFAGHAWLEA